MESTMNRQTLVRRVGGLALGASVLGTALAFAAAPTAVDLIVQNGTVVTVDGNRRVIADGAVAIADGRIVAVGPRAEVRAGHTARETLDAGGGIVLPGLVNAHTHAPMVLFRGVADDLRLMDWLQSYIFPAEKKNVTAAFVKAGTRLAALEMIRSGTTTFVDMYYFEDQVAEACEEAGMRCVAGETLIEFPAPDHATIAQALAYTERFLARWAGHARVSAAVAPHSTYLASPDTLRAARVLADRYRAPLLIHLSESSDEQRQVQERYGKSPTRHLEDLRFLRRGVLGAHGIYLTPEDRALLREAGAGVAHCPQSNMKLSSGAAPVGDMLRESVRLGLGTDGAASNNDLDMFEEMLSAALLAKHATGDPTTLPAPAALEMATLGGARALGRESELGSLEPGKRADLIVVGTAEPRLHPLYDPVSHLVYAAKGADVQHVVVEGRVIMRGRRVLTLDQAAVVAEADRLGAAVAESVRR
jgi:5-methylthioadenosine/S-adenosylhomocysteine deaminase